MKSTGIVRKVDDLGRGVLPKELRDTMDIDVKDPLEFYVDGDKIILSKYQPSCYFCESVENKKLFKDKYICESCIAEIEELKE